MGDPITQPNLPSDIPILQHNPIFVTRFEWAIQLPDLIFYLKSPNFQITQSVLHSLSGPSNYLTWFAIWTLQIARLHNFCHPVEWVIHLPNPTYQFKYQNYQNTQCVLPGWIDNPITQADLPPDIPIL